MRPAWHAAGQAVVGHFAMEMTMNVNAHVSLDSQRAALDLLNDRIGDAGEEQG